MSDPSQEIDLAKLYDDYLKMNVELIKSEQKNKNLTGEIFVLNEALNNSHERYKTTVGALELMSMENKDLKDVLSEVLGVLRDGLETFEWEPRVSTIEDCVKDAIAMLEEIE